MYWQSKIREWQNINLQPLAQDRHIPETEDTDELLVHIAPTCQGFSSLLAWKMSNSTWDARTVL